MWNMALLSLASSPLKTEILPLSFAVRYTAYNLKNRGKKGVCGRYRHFSLIISFSTKRISHGKRVPLTRKLYKTNDIPV